MTSTITVVGLGPGGREQWTAAAVLHLEGATPIYTTAPSLPAIEHQSLRTDLFDRGIDAVVDTLIERALSANALTYVTLGHPTVDDPVVPTLRRRAAEAGIQINLIAGLSLVDSVADALAVASTSLPQRVSALELVDLHHPPLAPDKPAIVNHLSPRLGTGVQRVLGNAYPAHHTVNVVAIDTGALQTVWHGPLAELDTHIDDQAIALYLPPVETYASFTTFQEVIAHLRAPEGCPWDREQTHQTLRRYLLEEAYEVLETIDADTPDALAEELGDLLLQIVLHTQIAIDTDEFQMGTVIDHITRKMIRRHPHVFGDVSVDGPNQVVNNWDAIKRAEKAAKGEAMSAVASVLDGVPGSLPALLQAYTISKRVVRVGFEWPDIEGVLDKLVEEAQEVAEATEPTHIESEIGDLLFTVVNLARWKGIDPESALRTTNARFSRRFKRVEALAAAEGKQLPDMPLAEMEVLWQQAKKIEG